MAEPAASNHRRRDKLRTQKVYTPINSRHAAMHLARHDDEIYTHVHL